jgi:SAM-dependent methyltransferase
MVNLNYSQIFEARGHKYHGAMAAQPEARRAEFERLFDVAPVEPGQTLLDLPAGGGYLSGYVPAGVSISARELTGGFGAGVPVLDAGQPWSLPRFDHVVCMAALHHIPDQSGFVAKLAGHTEPGGVLHVADVGAHSPLGTFLDSFVGKYNLTGHEGNYLDEDGSLLNGLGTVLRAKEQACPWVFPDRSALLKFCNDLFGLTDCPRTALSDALDRFVGIEENPDGTVRLNWRLVYIDIRVGG